MERGLGALILIGDEIYKLADISVEVQSAMKGYGINIENVDAQKVTSNILIIVKDEHIERYVNLVHKKGLN